MTTVTSFITITNESGIEKNIRVFGNASNPYFCGKDICEIMDIKDFKDTLQSLVKTNHKTDLKSLLEKENKGLILPSWVGVLKTPTVLGSVDLENLSHNDGRLVVLSEPGVEDLLNGTRKHKNKEILLNEIKRFVYTIKYENNGGLVDFFHFISKMNLAIDFSSKWFQDLWYPLSRSQPSLEYGLDMVKKSPIILTENLLEWLGYKGRDTSDKQLGFLKLLYNLKIEYEEIDYQHPLAIEYPCVQNEIKTISKNNLKRKRWICMDQRTFKKVIMKLNTENADTIRDYYLNIEEAVLEYTDYAINYMVKKQEIELNYTMKQLAIKDKAEEELKEQLTIKNEQLAIKDKSEETLKEQLAIKDKSEEELKEQLAQAEEAKVRAERKAIRINKFMRRVTIKEKKLEWIYIATTKLYAGERLFKVGSTTRLSTRISGYNTGRPKEDSYYYCWVKKCYNSKDLDYHIQKLLCDFKHKENTELYCGIKFSDLEAIVNFIVDNYDKSIDYINNFIQTRLNQSLEEEDEEPPRLDYKKITYQIGEHVETIDLQKEDEYSIRDELDNILLSIKQQYELNSDTNSDIVVVNRKNLIDRLSKVTNISRKDLWYQIKQETGWTSSNKEINDGAFKYKITY